MTWRALDPAPHHICRFVVLLPNADLNEASLARAIWTLAGAHGASVQIIGLIDDWADEGLVRTRTALLAALLQESGLSAGVAFEQSELDWVRIVRKLLQPHDAIVCMSEQLYPTRTDGNGVALAPLSRHLAMLHVPVCELSNILIAPPARTFKRAFKTLLLPVCIIAVSLVLEVIFMSLTTAWAGWVRHAVIVAYAFIELVSVARLTQE